MFLALLFQYITVAGGRYHEVLLLALGGMAFADLCCAIVFLRGGGLRWAAVAIALPSVFIILDSLRRALGAWKLV
jgi:hypothetical protein